MFLVLPLPIKNHGFRYVWAIIVFSAAYSLTILSLFFYGSYSSCLNTSQALKITVLSPISLMSDVIEPEKFVCIGCIFIMSVQFLFFTSQLDSPRNNETTQLDTLILSLLIIMCDICFSVGEMLLVFWMGQFFVVRDCPMPCRIFGIFALFPSTCPLHIIKPNASMGVPQVG